VPAFDLILSFTGGPALHRLERAHSARRAVPLYCSVDPDLYRPQRLVRHIDLGYLGTYSPDRQSAIERLLNQPAREMPSRSFAVVGAQYPADLQWPENVTRIPHLAPGRHARFYGSQRYTLNVTRADMRAAGHSPSVRLFEAAACATPVISDDWTGLADLFTPTEEILIADAATDVIGYLRGVGEAERAHIARRARDRVLSEHTGARRALELEAYLEESRRRSAHVPWRTVVPVHGVDVRKQAGY
jgi:spore maturation protein CgeB